MLHNRVPRSALTGYTASSSATCDDLQAQSFIYNDGSTFIQVSGTNLCVEFGPGLGRSGTPLRLQRLVAAMVHPANGWLSPKTTTSHCGTGLDSVRMSGMPRARYKVVDVWRITPTRSAQVCHRGDVSRLTSGHFALIIQIFAFGAPPARPGPTGRTLSGASDERCLRSEYHSLFGLIMLGLESHRGSSRWKMLA